MRTSAGPEGQRRFGARPRDGGARPWRRSRVHVGLRLLERVKPLSAVCERRFEELTVQMHGADAAFFASPERTSAECALVERRRGERRRRSQGHRLATRAQGAPVGRQTQARRRIPGCDRGTCGKKGHVSAN